MSSHGAKHAGFRHHIQYGASDMMVNTPHDLRKAAHSIALMHGGKPTAEQKKEIVVILTMMGYIPYVGYNTRPVRQEVLRDSNGLYICI